MRPQTMMLVLAVLVSGCMASGTKIDQGRLTEIEKGKTSYEEVVQRYGKPNSVLIRDDSTKQAVYQYVQQQVNPLSFIPVAGAFIRSGSTENASTVFEFDAWGILQSYTSTQGESVTGTGFISGGRQ
jgi:hypothetical protein